MTDADECRVARQRIERLVDVGSPEVDPAHDAGRQVLVPGVLEERPRLPGVVDHLDRTTRWTGVPATVDRRSPGPKSRRIGDPAGIQPWSWACRSQTWHVGVDDADGFDHQAGRDIVIAGASPR